MKKVLFFLFMIVSLFTNAQCYSDSSIAYSPAPYSGTSVSLGNDSYSSRIPIGFNFCYYGVVFDSLAIGSNGIVTFNPNFPVYNDWCSPTILDIALPSCFSSIGPSICIMLPWQDLDPSLGGNITYSTSGTAPDRVFIVSFDNVPMDSCSKLFKGQVKIFETTNVIETHIANKDTCLNSNHGRAAHGLNGVCINYNPSGIFLPGRNYPNCVWTASNEGIRFYPTCNVCLPLSVNEINSKTNNFSISPNPFTNSTQIILDKTYHNISLAVYDIQGKLMLQKQYAECNQIQLNRKGLNNGMYFLKLTLDERGVETAKVIVNE